MRNRFDEQLDHLNREMIEMGALCEEIIATVEQALQTKNSELCKNIKQRSVLIDQMEYEIEARCMKLLLHQQPVARDLRQISAAMKMITDMERIGDQAEDIADIMIFLNAHADMELSLIQEMAKSTRRMVTESVDAYVKRDVALAKAVIAHDDIVDDYFCKMKCDIIRWIAKNPGNGEEALDLLMIAKYFERIGDHATNIAEWVIYSVTGEHEEGKDDLVR